MKKIIANVLKFLGFKPSWSTGICGNLTCGYGRLSYLGYWEYGLNAENEKESI